MNDVLLIWFYGTEYLKKKPIKKSLDFGGKKKATEAHRLLSDSEDFWGMS